MSAGNTQKDGTGNMYWLLVDSNGRLRINDDWSPSLRVDEGLNDSDKTIAVASGYEWKIQWVWVEYTSTATGGNRQLVVEIQDSALDVIFQMRAGVVQGASVTRYYLFAPMGAEITSFRDTTFLYSPLPPTIHLPTSYVIRVYDNNAVDAAADDMIIQMMVQQRS
jgi:hypothetical protein